MSAAEARVERGTPEARTALRTLVVTAAALLLASIRRHTSAYGHFLLPNGNTSRQNGGVPDETSPVNAAFGTVLKGAAREAGKSQADIAEAIGQSLATVQRIFAGKRNVTVTQFFEIADFIGMDPEDLLSRVTKKLGTMSEPPANLTELRQAKKRPAEMTDDELEAIQKKAAIDDPEFEQDEAELP